MKTSLPHHFSFIIVVITILQRLEGRERRTVESLKKTRCFPFIPGGKGAARERIPAASLFTWLNPDTRGELPEDGDYLTTFFLNIYSKIPEAEHCPPDCMLLVSGGTMDQDMVERLGRQHQSLLHLGSQPALTITELQTLTPEKCPHSQHLAGSQTPSEIPCLWS